MEKQREMDQVIMKLKDWSKKWCAITPFQIVALLLNALRFGRKRIVGVNSSGGHFIKAPNSKHGSVAPPIELPGWCQDSLLLKPRDAKILPALGINAPSLDMNYPPHVTTTRCFCDSYFAPAVNNGTATVVIITTSYDLLVQSISRFDGQPYASTSGASTQK